MTDTPWHRLDPRTLLTGPISALRQFALPILVGLIGITSSGGISNALWFIPTAVIVAGAIGGIPWLTTSYRVTTTHLEIRKGLLNRSTVTARLDRVRSVDLESPVLHQILGIVRLKVGTGVDDGQITLDSLAVPAAERLRTQLLHRSFTTEEDPTPPHGVPLAHLEWSWLRFAPLNLVNATIAIGALLVIGNQLRDLLGDAIETDAADAVRRLSILTAAIGGIVVALLIWIPGSCLAYATRWFNLRVTREQGKDGTTLHQQAGLLTNRSTTVEEAKVRGVCLRSQLLIAAAGGAELSLLTIGLENNRPAILPAAPLTAVRRIATEVLNDEAPLTAPLIAHGRVVRWRYLRRATYKTAGLAAAGVGITLFLHALDVDWPWWASFLVLAAFTALWFSAALLRFRNLGHALTERHLVAQSGALTKDRIVLELDGIVGWKLGQSYFDRRLGLAQLTATTAAGDEFVLVRDIPLDDAVDLAHAATPHVVGEFVDA